MKKTLGFFMGVALSANLFGQTIIDVFGATEKQSADIVRKYGAALAGTEETLKKSYVQANSVTEKELQSAFHLRQALIKKIKREYGLLFVEVNSISYPDKQDIYTTIEVIGRDAPQRLQYVNQQPTPSELSPASAGKGDLIDKMIEYTHLSMELLLSNQLENKVYPCPVYHCTMGFHDPKLKPYLAVFNKGVLRQKKLIDDTMAHDPDPARRAAAAFLIGHYGNPRQIISALLPYVNYPDDGVRNNVIRVIGGTMQKAAIYDVDVMPFLALLDSPYETDRNKSLGVLFEAANDKQAKEQIIRHGKNRLLNLLALKQPNNHDYAYLILKRISGKDLGEDVASWKKWAQSMPDGSAEPAKLS